MKTYNTVAIETDINGVNSNEELTALFTRALELCQTAKPLQAIHRSSPSSTQYFSSQNITYTIHHAKSVDLKPIPLPEIDFQQCLQNVQVTLTHIKQEREDEIEEASITSDNIEAVETDDESIINGFTEKDSTIHVGKHMTTCSAEEEVNFFVCDEVCRSQEALNSHIITHEEGNTALEEENVMGEIESTAKYMEAKMKCPLCGKLYARPKAFKKHLAKHNEEGYICPYCQRDCQCMSALEIHVRSHTKEKPYPCQHCDKAFATTPRLKEHTMRHLGDKPHRCSVCDKAFVSKNELNDHLRIHTGERPHQCELCDKAFIAKNKLVLHMRTHTGERPHPCQFCEKTFMRKQHLSEHIKTHSRERPFICPYCSMSFISKWNFSKHVDRHTGEKPYDPHHHGNSPYKCEYCDVVFGSRRTLNKHLEQPHQL